MRTFLGDRTQSVVVVGCEESDTVPIIPGMPYGSVLGPILFLLYINDLPENVTSKVRVFADGIALYRTREGENNNSVHQQDFDRLCVWDSDRNKEFYPLYVPGGAGDRFQETH